MRADFKVTNPDEIEMELTLTMSLKAWKELQEQLLGAWPAFTLARTISGMISQADKHFYPKDKEATLAEE